MSERTPGPWRTESFVDDGYIRSSQFERVYGDREDSDWVADCGLGETAAANARLIAAAPDLLAASKAAAELDAIGPKSTEVFNQLRDAIKLAEGP